jgi:hypothetical protein
LSSGRRKDLRTEIKIMFKTFLIASTLSQPQPTDPFLRRAQDKLSLGMTMKRITVSGHTFIYCVSALRVLCKKIKHLAKAQRRKEQNLSVLKRTSVSA